MKILLKLRIKEWATYMPACKPRDLLLDSPTFFASETKAYKGHTFLKFQTSRITGNTQILEQHPKNCDEKVDCQ